jgi:hypothetical protein
VNSWTTQVEAKQSWAMTMQSTHSKGLRIHTDIMERLAKTAKTNVSREFYEATSKPEQQMLPKKFDKICIPDSKYCEQHTFFEVSAIVYVLYRRTGIDFGY